MHWLADMPYVVAVSYVVRRKFTSNAVVRNPGDVLTKAEAEGLGNLSKLISAGYLFPKPESWERRHIAMETVGAERVARHPQPTHVPPRAYDKVNTPHMAQAKVETSGYRTVSDVLGEVGSDKELAAVALSEEQASEKPRKSLVKALEDIIGSAEQEEPAE
jgi:hypothetical protein